MSGFFFFIIFLSVYSNDLKGEFILGVLLTCMWDLVAFIFWNDLECIKFVKLMVSQF